MTVERVEFTADAVTLVGNLAPAADAAPAVVLTGPFTGVKEQVTGVYAARLHARYQALSRREPQQATGTTISWRVLQRDQAIAFDLGEP